MNVNQSRRSKPRFTLTKWLDFLVKRYEGSWVRGKWVVSPTPQEHTVKANVQPMKPQELMVLTESERTRDWIKIYIALETDNPFELRTAREGNDGWMADRVEWHGDEYEVMKVSYYQMGTLDHIKAIAARVPISAK